MTSAGVIPGTPEISRSTWSPGAAASSAKTTIEIPSRIGTICTSLRITYRCISSPASERRRSFRYRAPHAHRLAFHVTWPLCPTPVGFQFWNPFLITVTSALKYRGRTGSSSARSACVRLSITTRLA